MTPVPWADPDFRSRALKSRDAWWTVLVVDPIALPVLSVLVRVPAVTPIGITTVGAAVGLAAIISFLAGHLVLGAVLFELRFFLDCLDGKLARLRGLASARGAFLDLTMDVVLVSGAMAGLGWHLRNTDRPVPLAVSAGCTFVCLVLFWLILYDLDHPQPPSNVAANAVKAESAIGRWLRHHRLWRRPRTIEVETLLLFFAPLIGDPRVLYLCFVVALGYYVLAVSRLFLRLLSTSALIDPTAPSAPPQVPAR